MNKHFPDKAIDIIDEASARASTFTTHAEQDENYKSLNKEIEDIQDKIQAAIAEQDYFLAAELKLKQKDLKSCSRRAESKQSGSTWRLYN